MFFLANFCDDDGGDDGNDDGDGGDYGDDDDGDGGDGGVSTTKWVWFVGSFHVN